MKRKRHRSNQKTIAVVHIGTEKTGTTSIQQLLNNNQSNLQTHGVYVLRGREVNNRDVVDFFQTKDSRSLRVSNPENDRPLWFRTINDENKEGFGQQLSNLINENPKALIISSEYFSSRMRNDDDLRFLKTFLDENFDEIKIICYFRPQEELAISLHSTRLRIGDTVSLSQRLASVVEGNYYYNYLEIANKWASVFGKENLVVRLYDRDVFPEGDVRKDFLKVLAILGVPAESSVLDFDSNFSNVSLSSVEASVYRAINSLIPPAKSGTADEKKCENKMLKKSVNQIANIRRGKFRPRLPGEVQGRFAHSNQKLLSEFYGDDPADFSPEEVEEESMKISEVEDLVYDLTNLLLLHSMKRNNTTIPLVDADADYLSDVAERILKNHKMGASDAIHLLELAQRARPEGPKIRKLLTKARGLSSNSRENDDM